MIQAKDILEKLKSVEDATNAIEVLSQEPDKPVSQVTSFEKLDWGTPLAKTSWEEVSDEALETEFEDSSVQFNLYIQTLPRDHLRHEDERYTIHLRGVGSSNPVILFNDYLLNEPAFESLKDALSRFEYLSSLAEKDGSIGIGIPTSRVKDVKPMWMDTSRVTYR